MIAANESTDKIQKQKKKKSRHKPDRMSCFSLRAALDELGLRQADLMRITGNTRNTVWTWVNGKANVPRYVWVILTLLYESADDDDDEAVLIENLERVKKGNLKQFEPEEQHIFPDGYSKQEYRSLCKIFHPDLSKRDTSAELDQLKKMNEILEAEVDEENEDEFITTYWDKK